MAKDIHEAIHEVMRKVGYVQKQESHEGGVKYKFAGEAALIEALRPAMVETGIYAHVAETPDVFRETYTTKQGTPMNRTAVRLKVRFTHAPSGSFIDTEAWGEGSDVGDKSTPKAMTGAYKYALRETFCIETGDDPDNTSSQRQTRASRVSQPRSESADNGRMQPTEADAKAKSEFWVAATTKHGITKQSFVHELYGEPVEPGALDEYVARRAGHMKTTPAKVWKLMIAELPKKLEAYREKQGPLVAPSVETA